MKGNFQKKEKSPEHHNAKESKNHKPFSLKNMPNLTFHHINFSFCKKKSDCKLEDNFKKLENGIERKSKKINTIVTRVNFMFQNFSYKPDGKISEHIYGYYLDKRFNRLDNYLNLDKRFNRFDNSLNLDKRFNRIDYTLNGKKIFSIPPINPLIKKFVNLNDMLRNECPNFNPFTNDVIPNANESKPKLVKFGIKKNKIIFYTDENFISSKIKVHFFDENDNNLGKKDLQLDNKKNIEMNVIKGFKYYYISNEENNKIFWTCENLSFYQDIERPVKKINNIDSIDLFGIIENFIYGFFKDIVSIEKMLNFLESIFQKISNNIDQDFEYEFLTEFCLLILLLKNKPKIEECNLQIINR